MRGKIPGVPVKPDPTGVRGVLRELNALASETLFVGDSDVDMETAHNARMTACGVTWGFRGREELQQAGAEHLVNMAEELTDLILR